MRTLDLELLRALDAIARHATFAAAAEHLHKTQSAVTQQMQRLEAEIGSSLFEKQGRGKRLTVHGEQLLAYARRMLALNDQALQSVGRLESSPRLRIGSPHDVADTLLPSLLSRFVRALPELQMTIEVGRSPFLMDALREGRLDLTISTRFDDSLPGVRLRTSPTVWICAHDFIYVPGTPVPLVLADEPSLFRKLSLDALSEAGIPWRVRFLAPTLAAIRAGVRAGLGITGRSIELADGGMRVLGPNEGLPPLPEAHYYLYAHPTQASGAARRLFEELDGVSLRFGPPLAA
ncbi:MAG TPA: LysR substrate-binding domain-containing protein [Ideonella sp.]|nr:LysR substrate-binding domain-containing protein [Ideonella sp.]